MTDTTTKLQQALGCLQASYLDIKDDSALHAGHSGNTGGKHYTVTIVSEMFNDLSLIARHRKVNELVKPLLKQEIHALSIEAKSPREFNNN